MFQGTVWVPLKSRKITRCLCIKFFGTKILGPLLVVRYNLCTAKSVISTNANVEPPKPFNKSKLFNYISLSFISLKLKNSYRYVIINLINTVTFKFIINPKIQVCYIHFNKLGSVSSRKPEVRYVGKNFVKYRIST